MRIFLVATVIALAVPFAASPASAAISSGVRLSYDYEVVPLDAGYQVVAYCNASADPDDGHPEDIPVATVVRCSVNTAYGDRGMPGRESVVVLDYTVASGTEVTLCLSGEAAFVDPVNKDVYSVSAPEVCHPLAI